LAEFILLKIVNKFLSFGVLALLSITGYGQPTEKSLRSYLENTTELNPIEGIWKVLTTREFYHFDTLYNVQQSSDTQLVAIIKTNSGFTAYYLSGDSFNLEFTNTDVKGVYMYRNYYPLIPDYSKKQAVICTHGKMEYTYDLPEEYVMKICGKEYQPNTRVVNILNWKKIYPDNP